MTASPYFSSYSNDILGNRTHQGGTPGTSFQYDKLNRMKYFSNGIGHDDYWYRADGMRVYKNHVSGVDWAEEGESWHAQIPTPSGVISE